MCVCVGGGGSHQLPAVLQNIPNHNVVNGKGFFYGICDPFLPFKKPQRILDSLEFGSVAYLAS